MGKLNRIAYYVDDSAPIFVPKRIINLLNKKTIIRNQYINEGTKRTLVIEYEAKKGSAHGVMEFYDMGTEEENIKEEK